MTLTIPAPPSAFATPTPSLSPSRPSLHTSALSRCPHHLRPTPHLRRGKPVRMTLQEPLSFLDHHPDPTVVNNKAKLPIVAVIGRPNVGKSTLVNRLTSSFKAGAIVNDVVGITRDRTYRPSVWNAHHFRVVDTGGLVFDDDSTFLPEIRAQALIAIQEAAVLVLCVDGKEGVNPLDLQLAAFLRKHLSKQRPVFVAVNKCESDAGFVMAADFWQLGLGEPIPVSAIHGTGTAELLDQVVRHIPLVHEELDDNVVNVAIVGRPNVGKSSLLNVMTGNERAIVSEIPGTTRDAIDEIINVHGKSYRLIDTAGIRRKTSVKFGTEFFMINRAFKAIRRADVVLLMLDVQEASDQDRKIADRIKDEGKACIVLANKWDLVDEKNNRSYQDTIDETRERTVTIPWAPVELISVVEKKRVSKILAYVDKALEQHRRRVSTGTLNEVLKEIVDWHKPPSTKAGKQGRVYYCTQVATRPPTIAMFVNSPALFHDNYRRYVEGQFRKALGFEGTPLRIVWRGKARAPVFE